MKSILKVLREIHKNGMVHCDIKPDNLMIKNDNLNLVYIIDYGFTRRLSLETKNKLMYWNT